MLRCFALAILSMLTLCLPAQAQTCGGEYADGYRFGTAIARTRGIGASGITCSAVFDDGTGPALYIGGTGIIIPDFGLVYLAKFANGRWNAIPGFNSSVYNLTVFDDGSGSRLYAVGQFTTAPGNIVALRVARFDGQAWSAMGSLPPDARCIIGVNTPTGPTFFAGLEFPAAVRQWNGSAWIPLGSTFINVGSYPRGIVALAYFDDGNGPVLYAAGGNYWNASQTNPGVGRWDGTAWTGVPGSRATSTLEPTSLVVQNDPDGPHLYAGGAFSMATTFEQRSVARLEAGAFAALPDAFQTGGQTEGCTSLLSVNDGVNPPYLVAAVGMDGHWTSQVRMFRNGAWSDMGESFGSASSPNNATLFGLIQRPQDDLVCVFGYLQNSGSTLLPSAGAWNGTAWQPVEQIGLGMPATSITADPDADDGTVYIGNRRYASGALLPFDLPLQPRSFVRLHGAIPTRVISNESVFADSGSGWEQLPLPPGSGSIRVFVVTDTGSESLVAIRGNTVSRFINNAWVSLGTPSSAPLQVISYDDGSGPRLYASSVVGAGSPATHLAVLDGGTWHPISGTGPITSMRVFDLGQGPELVIASATVRAWNGTALRSVSNGLNSATASVYSLNIMDAGDGPRLWCAQGAPYFWNGAAWETRPQWQVSALTYGMEDISRSDGERSIMLVGNFTSTATTDSFNIAELRFCTPACTSDFNHDGDSGTDQDIEAFFACLAGNCCGTCGTADFNNDGDVGTDADIESFFRVLAGGQC